MGKSVILMGKSIILGYLSVALVVILVLSFGAQLMRAPDSIAEAATVETQDHARLTPLLESNGDVVLFDFEEAGEVGRFVYSPVNTFMEPTSDVARTGSTSCAATFYVGDERRGRKLYFYTLMHPARGRMTDWSPYSEFQAAILNSEDFTVSLEVEYADNLTSTWRRYTLQPGVWNRIRQPIGDLVNSGIDISSMKRITWAQVDTDMTDINTLYFDDIRLIASDPEASETAVAAAWDAFEEWLTGEGSHERAEYIPVIHDDPDRIAGIQSRFDCGHIDGYVITDVCVVGGGISGCSAAIGSGRLGVETLLVEVYGFLGGTATAAMVTPFMSNRAGGRDLVRGVFADIVSELEARDGATRNQARPGVIDFDKEQLKYVLNDMVIDAGCKMMLHSWAERPLVKDGFCEGIIVDNKSGRLAILAQVVIDSTGDGDMAAGAGCPFEIGRGYDEYTQSTTLFFRIAGVNESVAFAEQGRRMHRPDGEVPLNYLFADLIRAAKESGRLPWDLPVSQLYFERTLQDGVVSINATRAFEVDATNVNDLTYASVETRRQAVLLADFMIDSIPGFQNAYLQETGIQVGVRESRRILGEYQLTGMDVLYGREFDDVIARGAYGIDIHTATHADSGVVGLDLEEGDSYDIPYRCLVPLKVENLLLAGRCISVTHIALGSVRIMPVCSGTGHAAGVAAALSVINEVTPRNLSYFDLQNGLISQNAEL